MIKIKEKILKEIKDHALEQAPIEACGYLGGEDNFAIEIYPMTNINKSKEHFSFSPEEQFKVLKESRTKGRNLLAIYHSHPETPARMSVEDIRMANDTNIIYIIYSILKDEVNAFKIDEQKQITKLEIEVVL